MKIIRFFLIYYLPLILWMATIFYFSSLPHFTISENSLTDFIIFKGLHMFEYGFLYFLIFRTYIPSKLGDRDKLKYSIFWAIIYAITDEIHQAFVPTREGKPRDIIIDSAGIFLIYLFIKNNLQTIKKYL